MGRLTEKYRELWQIKECDNDTCKEICDEQAENGCYGCPIQRAIDKLAEYEDLEEQGKLLKLPVATGETVYALLNDSTTDIVVCEARVKRILHLEPVKKRGVLFKFDLEDFGKTIFLTREAALKEMNQYK